METKERPWANEAGLSRRALLKAAPAAFIVGAVPAAAAAETETPVMALFREWEHASDAYNNHPSTETHLWRLNRLEDRILAIPSGTARDMACKLVIIADSYGGFEGGPAEIVLAEARALIAAA